MTRAIFLSISILFALGCSGPSDTAAPVDNFGQRVLGGAEVDSATFPQFVKLLFLEDSGLESLCSGVVLGNEKVLTAAHCFSEPYKSLSVTNSEDASKRYAVSSVAIHPAYRFSEEDIAAFNDVAVLAVPGLSLPGIPVLPPTKSLEGEVSFSVFGFGLDDGGDAGKLRSGPVAVQTVTENHYVGAPFLSGANPCLGDSGGALVAQFIDSETKQSVSFLAGIVSTGTVPGCGEGDTNFYTRLQSAPIYDFIF